MNVYDSQLAATECHLTEGSFWPPALSQLSSYLRLLVNLTYATFTQTE